MGRHSFFTVVGNGLSGITSGIAWLAALISQNWDVISTILLAAGVAFTLLGLKMLVAAIPAAIAWLAPALPLIILIGLIALGIIWLKKIGVSTEEIVGFIAGLFTMVVSVIFNGFAMVWNFLVDFTEFLVNLFIDPTYAIKKLFYDTAIGVLGFFDSMIQGIASGINWVIDKVNKLTNSNIQRVQVDFVSNLIDKMEQNRSDLRSDKNVMDFSHLRLEMMDSAKAFDQGDAFGQGLFDRMSDTFGGFQGDQAGWNAMQNNQNSLSGIQNDTGRIAKSVDIVSDDLQYFREVAEREAINAFTNATLAPQIQITFGDVKETADVEQIYGRITEIVNEELAVLAEGVHA